MKMLRVPLFLTLLTAAACGGSTPTLTPATAAKAEKDVVTLVRDASAEMLKAYKSGEVSSTISDPYFDAVDTKVLPAARRVKTAIRTWQVAAEGPAKIKSGEELKQLLLDLETESKAIFNTALPPGIAKSIGNIAQDIYDAIAKVRAFITAARTAELVDVNVEVS